MNCVSFCIWVLRANCSVLNGIISTEKGIIDYGSLVWIARSVETQAPSLTEGQGGRGWACQYTEVSTIAQQANLLDFSHAHEHGIVFIYDIYRWSNKTSKSNSVKSKIWTKQEAEYFLPCHWYPAKTQFRAPIRSHLVPTFISHVLHPTNLSNTCV